MVSSTEVGLDENKILVASSSDFVHNRLTPLLDAFGYGSLSARDGDEALASLNVRPHTIVEIIADLVGRRVDPNRVAGSRRGASPVPSAALELHASRAIGSRASEGGFRTPR